MERIETNRNDVEHYILTMIFRVRTAKPTIEDIQDRITQNKNNTRRVIVKALQLTEVKKIKLLDVKMVNVEKNAMRLELEVQKKKKEKRRDRIIERDNRIEQQRRKRERRIAR